MVKTIALAGTMDSKGEEFSYVKELVESLGFDTCIIHAGVFESALDVDISNTEVAAAAGESIERLVSEQDRAHATETLSKGMEELLPVLYETGKFSGILSLGGSGGTSIVTAGMRTLPVGVPKVMVSTVASGNTQPYVGTSDIMMIPSIVDISGLNVISTKIMANAAFAIAGMLNYENEPTAEENRPLIAASMFGLTTPCVNHAKRYLENQGYEVLVFHATGIGGQTMENLIADGFFDGVLDMTTTEWADELVGGVLSAGPNRLEEAGKRGVPQVVSVGAMDMVNFGPFDTVPSEFSGRTFYQHNPTVTLMRTTLDENAQLGKTLANQLNKAHGQTSLMLPLRGVSGLDVEGQAFYGPEEDQVLFNTIKQHLDPDRVNIIEKDTSINDPAFAEAAAETLVQLIDSKKGVT